MQVCKEQKNPRSKSQLLVTGKDKAFNNELSHARQMVEKVIEMADEAAKEHAEANDDFENGNEQKPYDKKFYGELSDIQEFTCAHKKTTNIVLKKAGGRFASIRPTNNLMWKPTSKVLSKEFIFRFPKFAPSSNPWVSDSLTQLTYWNWLDWLIIYWNI